MYAETGLVFPYQLHLLDDFAIPSLTSSIISDYNLGGDGDLFKAPEPVIGESSINLDPMIAAMSMTVSEIESSIESGQLLSEVFYECRKDLLAKEANETPLSEVLDIKIPIHETYVANDNPGPDDSFQKSVSSGSLRSMDGMVETTTLEPNFLDFPVLDFGTVYGMRRAFSDGDIKTLGNGDISFVQSLMGLHNIARNSSSEDRREKLSRYRNKKSKRNFGRKIKYACRKALADSQPRIRGRFAKTEEIDSFKKY